MYYATISLFKLRNHRTDLWLSLIVKFEGLTVLVEKMGIKKEKRCQRFEALFDDDDDVDDDGGGDCG